MTRHWILIALLAASCIPSDPEVGEQEQAAAGSLSGTPLWVGNQVRYYIDPDVPSTYDSSDPPACSGAAPAAPCGRSPRERIVQSVARYDSLFGSPGLHFVQGTDPATDRRDGREHLIYAELDAGGASQTHGYVSLRKAYKLWVGRCIVHGCDGTAEPQKCDSTKPSTEDQIAWRFARYGHDDGLRPGRDSPQSYIDEYLLDHADMTFFDLPPHEDTVVSLKKQTWPTDEGLSVDPGWAHLVLHETGHALGMTHEQKRPDGIGDNLLYFECNVIDSSAACPGEPPPADNENLNAFAVQEDALKLSPYDFNSVMQYSSDTKGKDDHNVILAAHDFPGSSGKATETCAPAGPQSGWIIAGGQPLSPLDINILYQMYPPQFPTSNLGAHVGYALAAGDFDNDGYLDLAAGAPDASSGVGVVYLYKGTYSGLVPWRRITKPTGVANDHDGFGTALAAGDIDLDGKADLVIGAPSTAATAARAGTAYVFLGSELGLTYRTRFSPGTTADDYGSAMAIGELNGNGAQREIAVGAPDSSTVYVSRLDGVRVRTLTGPAVSRFGAALAIGAVDGDGSPDLVIGAPQNGNGSIFVSPGVAPMSMARIDEPAGMLNSTADRFGFAVAVGRFGSGGNHIAIGAPGFDDERGRVYVMSLGPVLHRVLRRTDVLGEAPSPDARFGHALAIMKRTGGDVLIVGSPGKDATLPYGLAAFYTGTGTGSAADFGTPTGYHPFSGHERFGLDLAVGNFDNKATPDLAFGAPGANFGRGEVMVAHGTVGGPPVFEVTTAGELSFATHLRPGFTYSHWGQ